MAKFTKIEPIKGIRRITPIKSIEKIPPIEPVFKNRFSETALKTFLMQESKDVRPTLSGASFHDNSRPGSVIDTEATTSPDVPTGHFSMPADALPGSDPFDSLARGLAVGNAMRQGALRAKQLRGSIKLQNEQLHQTMQQTESLRPKIRQQQEQFQREEERLRRQIAESNQRLENLKASLTNATPSATNLPSAGENP